MLGNIFYISLEMFGVVGVGQGADNRKDRNIKRDRNALIILRTHVNDDNGKAGRQVENTKWIFFFWLGKLEFFGQMNGKIYI